MFLFISAFFVACLVVLLLSLKTIKRIFQDVDMSEKQELDENQKLDTVIIAGASTTGLVTAINFSKIAKKVILVDVNDKPKDYDPISSNKGHQPHVICKRSLDLIDKIVPGFINRLEKINDRYIEKGKNNQIFSPDRIDYNFSGLKFKECGDIRTEKVYFVSRGLLEKELRDTIELLSNVTVVYNTKIEKSDILFDWVGGKTSITSVKIGLEPMAKIEKCDVFINCAGWGQSVIFNDIAKATGGSLNKTTVNTDICYKTVNLKFDENVPKKNGYVDLINDKSLVYYGIMHPDDTGYLVMPFGHDGVLLMINTYGKAAQNTIGTYTVKRDILDMLPKRLQSSMNEILLKVVEDNAIVLGTYQKKGGEIVDYSNLNCGGIFAVGDVVGSLNPVYGQGITMGVSCSVLLYNRILQMLKLNGKSGLTSEFSNDVMNDIGCHYVIPWLLSTGCDMRYEHVHRGSLKMKATGYICHWATLLFFKAASVDSVFTNKLLRVLYMEHDYRKSLLTIGVHAIISLVKHKIRF